MSGGAKAGLIVGLTVGLVLVGILLVFLIIRRKYGPDMWKILSARVFRPRSTEDQRYQEAGSAIRGPQEHQSWYMEGTRSEHSEENSKTVLGNLWASLRGLFASSNTDANDVSAEANAIPLENQPRENSRARASPYTWSTVSSRSYNPTLNTPRDSPAIMPQTRQSSSRVSIPSYYIQYSNQFISPPQTPVPSSSRTDTSSTRDSDDQSRVTNIGSWAHYQKQRQQRQQRQQRKSRPPTSIEPINEQGTTSFSHSGPSGNGRSTRGEIKKHRHSSTSTLPVFRQHPGEEVDIGPSTPKRRVRSSILNRIMLTN